jgi:hypothetical protein
MVVQSMLFQRVLLSAAILVGALLVGVAYIAVRVLNQSYSAPAVQMRVCTWIPPNADREISRASRKQNERID